MPSPKKLYAAGLKNREASILKNLIEKINLKSAPFLLKLKHIAKKIVITNSGI